MGVGRGFIRDAELATVLWRSDMGIGNLLSWMIESTSGGELGSDEGWAAVYGVDIEL
jgi:hypothetical protein